jgi:hypothetical protein
VQVRFLKYSFDCIFSQAFSSALNTAVLQSEIETMQELKRRSDRSGGLEASADFMGGPMQ